MKRYYNFKEKYDLDPCSLWYRGISQSEFEYWLKAHRFKSSEVPVWCDYEVLEYCDLLEEDWVEEVCKESAGHVVNVTKDLDNARGYGNVIIGIDDSYVDEACNTYGTCDVDVLTIDNYGDVWCFVELPEDLKMKLKEKTGLDVMDISEYY